MSKKSTRQARSCCSKERERLMEELRACDYCSTSYEQFQRCYTEAARDSGDRSNACIASV